MSAFTRLMTIPQVWTIWVGHQAAGVSLLSWSAYLLSAVLRFWYGFRKGDLNIYPPCVVRVILNPAAQRRLASRKSMAQANFSTAASFARMSAFDPKRTSEHE